MDWRSITTVNSKAGFSLVEPTSTAERISPVDKQRQSQRPAGNHIKLVTIQAQLRTSQSCPRVRVHGLTRWRLAHSLPLPPALALYVAVSSISLPQANDERVRQMDATRVLRSSRSRR